MVSEGVNPYFNKTVIICALGYFVDIYDLVLFSIVRIASLKDLVLDGNELTNVGIFLLNSQMAGLLLGGILWGYIGDKKGRVSILFGSIALYSAANLANAFVETKEMYALLRFVAGIGLAGELGAAVTLVGESIPTHLRGYSTAFIAAIGMLGAIFAAIVAEFLHWRFAYGFGGILGLALLIGRVKLSDPHIFKEMSKGSHWRGDFLKLFHPWERLRRYVYTLLIGMPCWFVLGVLLAFGPEVTKELGVTGTVVVGTAVIFQYLGAGIGDFFSGYVSQKIQSRKKVLSASILATALLIAVFLVFRNMSPIFYYGLYLGLGLTTGYWAVFVTVVAEQFGTNLRATAASTLPNFVRGSVIPITLGVQFLRTEVGFIGAIGIVAVLVVALALFALTQLHETYSRDLNFFET